MTGGSGRMTTTAETERTAFSLDLPVAGKEQRDARQVNFVGL